LINYNQVKDFDGKCWLWRTDRQTPFDSIYCAYA